MGFARRLGAVPSAATPTGPADGRLGWFEGRRDDRLCGWTYLPGQPARALEVTLATPTGGSLTVRADRFRADLHAAGFSDGWHGFSAPVAALPGFEGSVTCLWSDLAMSLPGSPWTQSRRPGRRFRAGSVRTVVDVPNPGDPRLTGVARDLRNPFRRIRLRAHCPARGDVAVVASLYDARPGARGDDGFHGFVLTLPAPLRLLDQGVIILDADRDRVLARLGARSF